MSFSTKELNYIKDGLAWEELLVKKYNEHARYCQDPQVKNVFTKMAQMHQGHYNHLLGHITGQAQGH